ncbi:MAG: hypothetical protein QGH94_04845 [Phycisphaerae bacterium]|jgi:hypothetical protein|nr:hypothetical protein [Phycisphaerae bacterium]MDP7287302.1 hypothetical protein [Phycisphaerae bacterium]
MKSLGKRKAAYILTALVATVSLTGGCTDMSNLFGGTHAPPLSTDNPKVREYTPIDVPQPVNLLLPKSINIHPFTITRTFDDDGGIKGVDVRVEAFNSFHEATKAFGSFRFEIYTHQSNNLEPKGELRGVWEIEPSLLDAKENMRYWNRSQQMYEFKLQWAKPIPVGQKFVLVTVFTSPFTKRLTAQRIFTSGQ